MRSEVHLLLQSRCAFQRRCSEVRPRSARLKSFDKAFALNSNTGIILVNEHRSSRRALRFLIGRTPVDRGWHDQGLTADLLRRSVSTRFERVTRALRLGMRDAWLHIESCYPLLLFANNGCVSKTYQLFLTRIALQNQKLRAVRTVPKRSTGRYYR